jgi:acetolactate synthase-1/2/3 large subunit
MKLSDYLWDYIADQGVKHVFMVAGGGSMHLVDSLGQNKRLQYICCLHEQAAGLAAEAYAQFNGLGVCLVTSGPGGTNAITACASAWCNSMPVLFISGQVNTWQLKTPAQRFNGVQELDIISMVKPITKFQDQYLLGFMDIMGNILLGNKRETLKFMLNKAIEEAKTPRQSPVWIDIPLDIQSAEV